MKIKRISIIIFCYAFSSLGFFGSITALGALFDKNSSYDDFLAVIVFFAWVFHILMAINWAKDKKLGKRFSTIGTIFGIASILAPSLGNINFAKDSFDLLLFDIFMMFTPVVFVLPCLLLAIHMVMFHAGYEYSEKNA